MKIKYILLLIVLVFTYGLKAQNTESRVLKAGAAKIDITPSPDSLPEIGYPRGIRDHIHVRAIVVDNGITSAAFVSVEIDGIGTGSLPAIEEAAGIPVENIVISPTHTHSSIQLPRANAQNVDPNRAAFAAKLDKSIVEVVKKAQANLQPAQIGFKRGTSYVNVNRNTIDPFTRLWTQGPDYDGPSDKTVAVVTFKTIDGEPIAIYYNYGMHANSMYCSGILSADFPGETSRYIERFYDDKVVALYQPSAQGDQNPRYASPMQEIEKIKSDLAISSGRAKDSEEAVKMVGFKGGVDDIVEIEPNLFARQSQIISSMGQFLGEEILRVVKYTMRYKTEAKIFSTETSVTCSGRVRTSFNRDGIAATYEDGEPVNMGLKLLVVGDIAFAVMGGDPFSVIKEQLIEESPYNHTIMVVMSNGLGGGYIPSDDAYGMYTFQVLGSKIKPGCAERSIINGFLDLMDEVRK